MKYCSKCGQPNDDSSIFCSKCGSPFSEAEVEEEEKVEKEKPITVINKNSYHWDALRVVLAILLIGIMIAAFAIEG